jgi:hypothetical protein
MGGRIIVRGLGLGALAMALNVLVAFAWVFLYSVAIAPGHDGAFYQAYAQRVAPISAVLAGVPILFAAGWLAARGPRPQPAALLPAAAYIILDLLLVAAGGLWPSAWSLALSYLTKLAAAWAGGRMAIRRRAVQ